MDRRVVKTKTALKNAYKTLLLKKLNSKITITDLAKEADIDRKTFYLHYSSIDDILLEIMEDKITDLERELNQYNISETSLDSSTIITALNNNIMNDLAFYHALSKRSDFDIFVKRMTSFLLKRIFATSTSPIPQKELALCSKFLISGIVDVYADWFCNPSSLTLDELGTYVAKIIHNEISIF